MLLSVAIRKGIPITPELSTWCGCALGAAWAGVKGVVMTPEQQLSLVKASMNGNLAQRGVSDRLAETLRFDSDLCWTVSLMHYSGDFTREQCADYAEKWERDHGLWPTKERESDQSYAARMLNDIVQRAGDLRETA